MSDARELLKAIETMENAIYDSAKVILCCPEVKKIIEECGEIPPNCYVIENPFVPPNKAYIIQDRETKKVFIQMYEDKKRRSVT